MNNWITIFYSFCRSPHFHEQFPKLASCHIFFSIMTIRNMNYSIYYRPRFCLYIIVSVNNNRKRFVVQIWHPNERYGFKVGRGNQRFSDIFREFSRRFCPSFAITVKRSKMIRSFCDFSCAFPFSSRKIEKIRDTFFLLKIFRS